MHIHLEVSNNFPNSMLGRLSASLEGTSQVHIISEFDAENKCEIKIQLWNTVSDDLYNTKTWIACEVESSSNLLFFPTFSERVGTEFVQKYVLKSINGVTIRRIPHDLIEKLLLALVPKIPPDSLENIKKHLEFHWDAVKYPDWQHREEREMQLRIDDDQPGAIMIGDGNQTTPLIRDLNMEPDSEKVRNLKRNASLGKYSDIGALAFDTPSLMLGLHLKEAKVSEYMLNRHAAGDYDMD